ncbi:MAG: YfhO family protein [Spirochaetia bacterium]|nr:YfhO family protein [Spirochaetia bacterium]
MQSCGRSSRVWLLCIMGMTALFLMYRSNLFRVDPAFEVFERSEYDDVSYDFPMQKVFNERLHKGELPLWNPDQSAGNPTIGTLEARLLYPPRLIFTLIFGVERGQFLEIIFHVLLGVLGTFGMLRAFRIKPGPAVIGATCVLMSAEFLGSSYSHNVLATHAWIPVCILVVKQITIRVTYWRALRLAIAFSMLLYAGYPQFGYYALHACLIIFAAALIARGGVARIRSLAMPLALAVILFAMIVAPQISSSGEFFSQGIRGEIGVTREQFQNLGSRPIWSLVPLMFTGEKGIMGSWQALAFHQSTYVMALLIICGFAWGVSQKRYRVAAITMLLVAIPFALLAMGTGSPFADWVFDYYPLGSRFRVPFRARSVLLFPAVFGVALSVTALTHLMRKTPLNSQSRSIAAFVIILSAVLASILPGKYFRPQVFEHIGPYATEAAHDIANAIPSREAAYVNITGFATEPYKKSAMLAKRRSLSDYEPSNTYRSFLLANLLSAELRNQNAGWVWLGNSEVSYDGLADPNVTRLLRTANVGWVLGDSVAWKAAPAITKAKIRQNADVKQAGSIPDSRLIKFFQGQINPALHSFLKPAEPPALYQIFKIENPLSRAYISNRIAISSNAKESAAKMGPPFNPLSPTVVEIPASKIQSGTDPRDHLQPVRLRADSPERIVIETETYGNAFLILNDKFFPGWICLVNGKPVPIFAANVLFRAVQLPPGKHTVEFVYKPDSLYVTLILSGVAYLFLLVSLASFVFMLARRHSKKIATGTIKP